MKRSNIILVTRLPLFLLLCWLPLLTAADRLACLLRGCAAASTSFARLKPVNEVNCATGLLCLHRAEGTVCPDLLPATPLVLRIMMLLLCGTVCIVSIQCARTDDARQRQCRAVEGHRRANPICNALPHSAKTQPVGPYLRSGSFRTVREDGEGVLTVARIGGCCSVRLIPRGRSTIYRPAALQYCSGFRAYYLLRPLSLSSSYA